jgi:hypothetical protein
LPLQHFLYDSILHSTQLVQTTIFAINAFSKHIILVAYSHKDHQLGFPTTLAVGDIKFCITIQEKPVTWMLKKCLHASEVPINLISVSALQEHHMSITFSFQKTTITFLKSHPQLRGLSFYTEVIHHLSSAIYLSLYYCHHLQ